MSKVYKEFKAFISRGSIVDLAIAVVIGAAFKEIINSLVKDILTPIISLVIGEEGFENYKYVITEANVATGTVENAIYYGNFIQSILDFVIIAFVVFMIVKSINKATVLAKNAKVTVETEIKEVVKDSKPNVADILTDIKSLLSDSLSINNKE